jgi:hypothetical protein
VKKDGRRRPKRRTTRSVPEATRRRSRRQWNPTGVGVRSEGAILSEFLKRGYRVLLPFGGGSPYDLAVEKNGCLKRVQCKTARVDRSGRVLIAKAYSVTRRAGGKMVQVKYHGRVDLLAIYAPATEKVYLIPPSAVAGGEVWLRLTPTSSNRRVGIKMAKDFELK